jgi:hypothetical protein
MHNPPRYEDSDEENIVLETKESKKRVLDQPGNPPLKRSRIPCFACQKTIPIFNYPGELNPTHCKKCKEDGMIDVVHKMCIMCNSVRPNYNHPGLDATHCKKCKEDGMVNVTSRSCIVCNSVRPNFNHPGELTSTHCKKCKEDGMIDVRHKRCISCNLTRPHFNYPGTLDATHCGKCKKEGMIDINSKRCIVCNLTRPNYNHPGTLDATHCGKCKKEGMIDINSKRCIVCNLTRPNYNHPGKLDATHCKKCKEDGMVNVKDKKCIVCNLKQPCFNYPGKKNPTHCGDCKLNGMTNVSKKCIVCNMVRARFNYPGQKKKTHCGKCKKKGMINLASKRCEVEDCDIHASFGFLFRTQRWCSKHKKKGSVIRTMINPKCELCGERAFNLNSKKDSQPKRCEQHKEKEDINISEKPCTKCGLKFFLREDTDVCDSCYNWFYSKTRKKKQEIVRDFLSVSGMFKYLIGYDQRVENGFSNRMPDFVFKFPLFNLIVEVDENQHKSYPCECEASRMVELHGDFKGEPVVFIRYNPDAFKDHQKKEGKVTDNQRLKKLLEVMNGLLNRKEWNSSLTVYYLFYDGYDPINLQRFEWDYFQEILSSFLETQE